MTGHVGQLTAHDELLIHQHHDTFASVSTTDPSWTERVYGWAADVSGEVAIGFGLSRYLNRNVMDAYGLVALGDVQYNIRGSRRLFPDPHTTAVGPLRYEVVEPLRAVRCILEPTPEQPIAFDVTLRGTVAPSPETHTVRRGYRRTDDVTRYVQLGRAEGVVEAAGRRFDLRPESTLTVRDHSWGVRSGVGPPSSDGAPASGVAADSTYRMFWTPGWLELDGERTHVHLAHWESTSRRGVHDQDTSAITTPEGVVLETTGASWVPRFVGDRLEGVEFRCAMADGADRTFVIEPQASSRVFLGPGRYGGYRGRYHGEDLGPLHVEGDLIEDTSDPRVAPEIHQLSQEIARIHEPATGASGWCALQYEFVGRFPQWGLAERLYR